MKIEGNEIVVNYQPSGGKPWAAKIVGKDTKYGFKREFIRWDELRNMSSSGKTGNAVFSIWDDGYYEVQPSWAERGYVRVVDGKIKTITKDEVVI